MNISYDKLWLRLRERDMTAKQLQDLASLSSKTLARLRRNESVTTATLTKICNALEVDLDDIVSSSPTPSNITSSKGRANKTHTVASFFAGIGGFDVGFERRGFTTTYLCEINDFCNKVLDRHWPEAQRGFDINEVQAEDIPDSDVWVGGFPCQDISLARGRLGRDGLQGTRSGLFHRFAELVELRKPQVVLLENVAGLLNSNKGRDFGVILDRMSSMGYSVSWRMMNTRYFGAPQSRTRIYVCCWLEDSNKALRSMFESQKVEKPKNERKGFITVGSPEGTFPIVPEITYCLAATSGRHTGTDWSRTYVVCKEGVRRMTPVECERIQGFPDHWSIPYSSMSESATSEDIDTLRYTALGNAVSVPVIEWIAGRIKLQLEEPSTPPLSYDEIQLHVPGFEKVSWNHELLSDTDFTDDTVEMKWSKAGMVAGRSVLSYDVPPSPAEPILSNFADLAEKEPALQRYYLSPNAAEGIIRRVTRQNRSLFPPLFDALNVLRKK